ncbi:MAG: hypothetical protein ACTS73_07650 [Arsenophonus sp. NEOnobi-MAG3]
MPNEASRHYLFVGIISRNLIDLGFMRIYKAKTTANAQRFLGDLNRASPIAIHRVLTENAKKFTERLFLQKPSPSKIGI